ncbi:MAG TPA: hypothetical protein VF783_14365, partial [Terriglobales bacterium]
MLEPAQYCVGWVGLVELVLSRLKEVPPMDVAVGRLPGKSTERPKLAGKVVSQSAAPLSPDGRRWPVVGRWPDYPHSGDSPAEAPMNFEITRKH